MAITINGIVCEEIVANFGEEFDLAQGPRCIKGYYCAWPDRYTVVVGLLGLSTTVSIGGVITLETPAQYPQLATAYCTSVRVEPKGVPFQSSPQLAWPNCIVWAEYRPVPWSFAGIDYMQIDPTAPLIYARQNFDLSMQYYEVAGRSLLYSGKTYGPGQSWSFPCPILNMEVTLIRMPYLPAQNVIAAATAGPLNSGTFLGCPDGTVMFTGFKNQQTFDSAGNFTQDGTFSFSYRPVAAWDYAFDGKSGSWLQLKTITGAVVMQRTDLTVLFPGYYAA